MAVKQLLLAKNAERVRCIICGESLVIIVGLAIFDDSQTTLTLLACRLLYVCTQPIIMSDPSEQVFHTEALFL
jgi:hypothetical protein